MSCSCQPRTSVSYALVPPGTALVNSYVVSVLQRLCSRICLQGSVVESSLSFDVVDYNVANATAGIYEVNIRVHGLITYTPANSGNCCSRTEIVDQIISVPAISATGIASVAITQGAVSGEPVSDSSKCGCVLTSMYRLMTSITVTVTAA